MTMRQLSLMPVGELRPIDAEQQRAVVARTQYYLDRAAVLFQRAFPSVAVQFDLRGQSAGQFHWTARSRQCVIRYNPWVFAADFEHHLTDTVIHEVAHYLVYQLYGARTRAHGMEWRRVMKAFGIAPRATGRYDLTGVPVRRQQRHSYRCDCRQHELTSTRHNRHQQGSKYICRSCGVPLEFVAIK